MHWQLKNKTLDLSQGGKIMGILNTTPDSFSDGGLFVDVEKAVQRAMLMLQQGADIIDIGGESTRPGAEKVSVNEEIKRTIPVIERLRALSSCVISIDSSKAEVARLALEAGADIINDVTGLKGDPAMLPLCQKKECGLVIMHMQGTPQTMQDAPSYTSVCAEVRSYFLQRFDELTGAGIAPQRLCFDPGIGFGKSVEHNLALLRDLESLKIQNRPLLLGVSRKSILAHLLEEKKPQDRDWGTLALSALGHIAGVEIHRVHEIANHGDALRMIDAITK